MCFDPSTNVSYNSCEEWVRPGSPTPQAIGICVRCGEILDEPLVRKLAARGDNLCQDTLRKAGIAYLSADEKTADAALAKLTAAQRRDLLARQV